MRLRYTYLQGLAFEAIWLIHKDIRSPTHSNLTRSLIKSYRFKGVRIIDVDRLKQGLRAAENDQRVAGDVRLSSNAQGQRSATEWKSKKTKLQRTARVSWGDLQQRAGHPTAPC